MQGTALYQYLLGLNLPRSVSRVALNTKGLACSRCARSRARC